MAQKCKNTTKKCVTHWATHLKYPIGCYYIIPPIPPCGIAGIAGASVFLSAKTHSVVRNIEAIEAAFSKATRDTFVGSMIPATSISSYLSSRAL